MFIRVVDWVLSLALYALTFIGGFMTVSLIAFVVLRGHWMAFIIGVLAGLFAVWFVRGLVRETDEVFDFAVRRVLRIPQSGEEVPPHEPLPSTNPHDRLRRLSDLRKEGLLSADEYEAKRQEILREL